MTTEALTRALMGSTVLPRCPERGRPVSLAAWEGSWKVILLCGPEGRKDMARHNGRGPWPAALGLGWPWALWVGETFLTRED